MLSHFQTDITLLVSPNTFETLATEDVPLPTKFQPTTKLGVVETEAIVVVVEVDVVEVASLEVLVVDVVVVVVVVELVLVLVTEETVAPKLRAILYKSFS